MNVPTTLRQLKEKYPWLTIELETIKELMEEACASAYLIGAEEPSESTTEYSFTSYGDKEDWE